MSSGIGSLSGGLGVNPAQQALAAQATKNTKSEKSESTEASSIVEGQKQALPEEKRSPIQTGNALNVSA